MGLPGALWGDPGSPKTPPERPRDGPWQSKNIDVHQVVLRFRGSVRLSCSSGSNNQRRMRREQSKTSHSGGQNTEKQKGTARGRFSPERTHQNHRFPMGFFMFSPNSTLLCKSARGKKQHQTKPTSRPKRGRQAPLGSPPGLFGGPLALQNHGFCQGKASFFKKMNKTARCTPKRSQKTPHDKAQPKQCSHNDKKSL